MGLLRVFFRHDAIAARNFCSSALFMTLKRKGCKPIGAAEQGLSSSAIASTGPRLVENITSTTALEWRGLSTRSKPPVTEMVWSLADVHPPSPNRIFARGMPGSRTRTGRRVQRGTGEVITKGNMLLNRWSGEITNERVRSDRHTENRVSSLGHYHRVFPHKRMKALRSCTSCIREL